MKLLTRAERDELADYLGRVPACPPFCVGQRQLNKDRTRTIRDDLFEQGRILRAKCICHGAGYSDITPAGREALRLWPLLVERGLVE